MLHRSEIWWEPASLEFQEIHVRGSTDWTTILMGDSDGVFGQGEITSTQLDGSVASLTARLANRMRGVRIGSDDDVLRLLSIDPADLERIRNLPPRSARFDAPLPMHWLNARQ